ncbi:lipocalin family protein [Flavobacterium sp.]|uniref:lipocalin family protein n=1 Tax=Flavobacterium sp. TaxID=239 RepID=UPI0026054843|nr:lipocalin family protein [Flavobacterium sp.]
MKNRGILLALALSIGLFTVSCSEDNEGETVVPLSGKWEISQVGTIIGDTETLTDAPQNEAGCNKDYMDLKIDNTVIEGDYDSTISACALSTDDGIWSRSHNNLTKVVDGVTTVQDIVNLTIHELKLKDASGNVEVYTR